MATNNEVIALAYFMQRGLSPAQAAGIVGNLRQESNVNPKEAGGFVAQWGGSRLANLESYAHARHESVENLTTQLGFIWQELNTSERGTLNALVRTKTPETAARVFSEMFERPGIPALSNRERYAREAYGATTQSGFTKDLGKLLNPLPELERIVTLPSKIGSAIHTATTGVEDFAKVGSTLAGWIENPLIPVKFVGGAILVYMGVRTLQRTSAGGAVTRESGHGVGYALEGYTAARVATRTARKLKRPAPPAPKG